MRPVVSVWFLEKPLFRDGPWFHAFSLRDEESGARAIDDLLIVVVELQTWIAARGEHLEKTVASSLDCWLYLLWKAEDVDPADPPVELAGREYREALEIMRVWTKSDEARDLYRRRLDYQRTMATIKAEGIKQGLVEGMEKGRTEGARETAKALKELGVDVDVIVKATKLSRAEVEGL